MSITSIIEHVHHLGDPKLTEPQQKYNIFISDKKFSTTVTSMADNADRWICNLEHIHKAERLRLIVGFDIKLGTPEEPSDSPPIALLVLCVYRTCLIFELTYFDSIPFSLAQFLSDHNNILVGVDIESKLAQLRQEYGIGDSACHHDLGSLVAARYNRADLNDAGLSRLRTFLHGRDVQRPPVAGDWDEPDLSNAHVHYATIDAYTCYELGSYLVYPSRRRLIDRYYIRI